MLGTPRNDSVFSLLFLLRLSPRAISPTPVTAFPLKSNHSSEPQALFLMTLCHGHWVYCQEHPISLNRYCAWDHQLCGQPRESLLPLKMSVWRELFSLREIASDSAPFLDMPHMTRLISSSEWLCLRDSAMCTTPAEIGLPCRSYTWRDLLIIKASPIALPPSSCIPFSCRYSTWRDLFTIKASPIALPPFSDMPQLLRLISSSEQLCLRDSAMCNTPAEIGLQCRSSTWRDLFTIKASPRALPPFSDMPHLPADNLLSDVLVLFWIWSERYMLEITFKMCKRESIQRPLNWWFRRSSVRHPGTPSHVVVCEHQSNWSTWTTLLLEN